MKILITGGAGFIGSHAAEFWAMRGHDVVVLDNLTRSALLGMPEESTEHNWRYLSQCTGVRLIQGDVRSAEDVRRALSDGVDAILHAAGQTSIRFSLEHPEEDFAINALGTLRVLELARQHCPNVTFLYCSTNKVYGTHANRAALSEQATRYAYRDGYEGIAETNSVDLVGHTPYGVSKLTGDLYVQDYAHTYGLRTAVFRMSCIYGPRQFGVEDQGWVTHFTRSTLLDRTLTIYGDGKQVRDVLYIDDLIQAFDRFIRSGLRHGVFNIGGGISQSVSLLELLDLLQGITGKRSPVTYQNWRPSDQRVYISDLSHIQRALQWQPHVKVTEGVARLLQWVEQHRDLFHSDTLESSRLI